MSWDDPFDNDDDERRRQLRKWLGDFLPESVFQQIEEMMERLLDDVNKGGVFDSERLDEFMKTAPFMWGFQMKIGPDGKPHIQQFGNTRPNEASIDSTSHLEPLVDIIEDGDDLIVVAELPGVEKDEIKVRVKGDELTIDVQNPTKPYYKTIALPVKVKKDDSRSSIRNGVLEIRLKKA